MYLIKFMTIEIGIFKALCIIHVYLTCIFLRIVVVVVVVLIFFNLPIFLCIFIYIHVSIYLKKNEKQIHVLDKIYDN